MGMILHFQSSISLQSFPIRQLLILCVNRMMSVNYPSVYRSFAKNFGFSAGLIPFTAMQESIDTFRQKTGGNLTGDSVQFLKNATLVFSDDSSTTTSKREVLEALLWSRDSLSTSANATTTAASTNSTSTSSIQATVSGIKAYVEELSVPQANTFMTVLLIVACVIAAIAVGILFFKVLLETWALFSSFPKSLTGFRKHYWGTMARSIVNLILVLYGIWVLYCVFQFTHGDSWAAKLLAGLTLALFTGVLAWFTFKIWQHASRLKKTEGDVSGLYQDKETWLKYSLFYDNYKKDFFWLFIPTIIYMAAKGCVLAAADGHGLTQTVAQLVIECLSKSSPNHISFQYLTIPSARPLNLEPSLREKIWKRNQHIHPSRSSSIRRLHSRLCRRAGDRSDHQNRHWRRAHRHAIPVDRSLSYLNCRQCNNNVLQRKPSPQETQGSGKTQPRPAYTSRRTRFTSAESV